ncbi:unnamed protein product [Brachionus calyciflorus]|uniref:Uncharacterized protein n=1 Tax=Brachionus calyciflorus TaxID=104777 RepID=A0A813PDG4_9BILA|nr:unnamed protein product [Brachionus calyciflorus]
MSLQLIEKESNDPFLKQATFIANLFLRTDLMNYVFKEIFKIDFDLSQTNLVKTEIVFHDMNYRFGFTERDLNANKIFINSLFYKRLNYLERSKKFSKCSRVKRKKNKEIKTILMFIAITILHEIGHLLFRWKGILNTAFRTIVEPGYFLESKLFGGKVRFIKRPNQNWDESSKIIGIAILKKKSKQKRISVRTLSYKKYIKKAFGKTISAYFYQEPVFDFYYLDKHDSVLEFNDEKILVIPRKPDYIRGPVFFSSDYGERTCHVQNPVCEQIEEDCCKIINKMVREYLDKSQVKNKVYLILKLSRKMSEIIREVGDANSDLYKKLKDADKVKLESELNALMFNDII